ncbi:DUF3277 family protein [Xenorhabdus bovienii]|uniref:phage protein n=1 Tax=Xenorhabdus bovienii TaxID=40576 RepID=UPI00237D061E|nr:phage protein [Xenorhabdus bovienii]MDE1487663.1 DUF3277 family protein [Xenorhabdus bovienii]MDE9478595.1 DUF3277 family protein [Xenorhabdus bovienii]MDE9531834.1 DUF3277 family protein [Xenorhabdus bovienii]MDE9536548.1 DUF3277 family protein [Xenorhabdus bovienii]MDE9589559.1 DUF3277 family protein [Xenorhabdus bovienii]
MAQYNHAQSILTISGYEITGYENTGDALNIAPVGDDGDPTYGINGNGVFVAACNKGMILTLKLLQHCADNEFLNKLRNIQNNTPKAFSPLHVYYKDTMNGDEIMLEQCFFTTPPTITRGTTHNGVTWTLKSISSTINLKKGLYNS